LNYILSKPKTITAFFVKFIEKYRAISIEVPYDKVVIKWFLLRLTIRWKKDRKWVDFISQIIAELAAARD